MAIPGGGNTPPYSKALDWRTATNCTIDNIAENNALANKGAKENAANLAGFNGVKTREAIQNSHPDVTPDWAARHPIIALHFCGVVA
jgi:hypothetical protein